MDEQLWTTAFGAVADAIISMFGYFFTVIGAAASTLLALTVLGAVLRLIVKPIVGYKLDNTIGVSALRSSEMKARMKKNGKTGKKP